MKIVYLYYCDNVVKPHEDIIISIYVYNEESNLLKMVYLNENLKEECDKFEIHYEYCKGFAEEVPETYQNDIENNYTTDINSFITLFVNNFRFGII